jgi:hypothetical protein
MGGGSRENFPFDGSILDLDFVNQRWFWGGAAKSIADFTTFTLNGSTFGGLGLTPSTTIDVTVALAGVGTVVPGVMAGVFAHNALPAGNRIVAVLDNGTNNESIVYLQTPGSALSCQVITGGVSQSNVGANIAASALNTPHAFAGSFDANNFLSSTNGVAGNADVSGTLPTVTTLRIGKNVSANTEALGAIARLVLFTAAKTQAELNQICFTLRGFYRR